MPISSRLISIYVSAKPHNITIIQVYAPTTDHDDEEEVKKFYEILESTIMEAPKKNICIIQVDWNAKVGPDAMRTGQEQSGVWHQGDQWQEPQTAWDCQKPLPHLSQQSPPHKLSQTATWHSNNGQVHNQIDFILALQCFKSSINKAKWGHSLVPTLVVIMTSWWQPSNWSWKPSIVLKTPAFALTWRSWRILSLQKFSRLKLVESLQPSTWLTVM